MQKSSSLGDTHPLVKVEITIKREGRTQECENTAELCLSEVSYSVPIVIGRGWRTVEWGAKKLQRSKKFQPQTKFVARRLPTL